MSKKFQVRAIVLAQEQISEGIFSLLLGTGQIAREAMPGQFISMYSQDQSRLLPRPISICETNPQEGTLRVVYRRAGEGTAEFSRLVPSQTVDVIGPLGQGFPLEIPKEGLPSYMADGQDRERRSLLIGGGIGIPPLVELAKRLPGKKTAVLGYRDAHLFLTRELSKYGEVVIATEDGSVGTKGNVLDAIRANDLCADIVYACGPTPMLKGIKQWAEEEKLPCYLSLEERMACGIGACLACVCQSTHVDAHSQVNNKRVCADGPVFLADEITW